MMKTKGKTEEREKKKNFIATLVSHPLEKRRKVRDPAQNRGTKACRKKKRGEQGTRGGTKVWEKKTPFFWKFRTEKNGGGGLTAREPASKRVFQDKAQWKKKSEEPDRKYVCPSSVSLEKQKKAGQKRQLPGKTQRCSVRRSREKRKGEGAERKEKS